MMLDPDGLIEQGRSARSPKGFDEWWKTTDPGVGRTKAEQESRLLCRLMAIEGWKAALAAHGLMGHTSDEKM